MKKLVFGLIATVLLSNFSVGQVTITEFNKQLEIFKTQVKNSSNSQIVLSDESMPKNLTSYLSKISKCYI